jgi:hypothetical protein
LKFVVTNGHIVEGLDSFLCIFFAPVIDVTEISFLVVVDPFLTLGPIVDKTCFQFVSIDCLVVRP